MKLDIRPTTECDAAALSEFLRRMFHLGADASIVAQPHMRWKYWSPRQDWAGARSFTARCDGAIVAHAAVWPARVRVPGRVVPAAHVIDWAADPRYPGAGISIMRHIARQVGLMIATGGSEITRRILPVIGFRPHGELEWFARPVRPLGQALTTARKSWRLPARLLRNTWWRFSRPLSFPRGWSARPLAPEEIPQELWPRASPATAVTVRDAGLYRYFVDSPSTRHALVGLEERGVLVGYFCLSFSTHAARIADLWLPSTDVDDWHAAFQSAAVVASREADVFEVSAWASTALGKVALTRAGFRSRDRQPVSFLGNGRILEGLALHVQMLDCDASFLSEESVSYLT
jgi:GNAT acetyltransferase-like protein